MLQADAAHGVGDRQQEFVLVVVLGAEHAGRLLDELLVRVDLLGGGVELFGGVGEDVEVDARRQRPLAIIFAGKGGGVDQRLVAGALVGIDRAVAGRGQACRRGPAGRIFGSRLDRDAAGEIAGRVEADRVPLEVQHRGRHDDAALVTGGRRQELEADVELLGAGGHVDVEGEDVDRVTGPGHHLAIGADHQAGELLDLTARAVRARQPLREQQHHVARLGDGNRLLHVEDAALDVGRVDLQQEGARIVDVARGGDGVGEGHRLRQGVAGGVQLRMGGNGRSEQQGGERRGAKHDGLSSRWDGAV